MPHPPSALARRLRRLLTRPRGMALLLVMIGMVVCTILTAGFLATQGTAIGIARNERDAAKCHAIAQSGIDMCFWLIKNKSDWRTTMNPSYWLTNAAIGDGAVSVYVDDDDHNFADDPSQPVTLTATGAYDSRSFTLAATIRPTGGGTVFQNGNFISGNIAVGNADLKNGATIDSFNSSVAAYSSATAGSNAAFASNAVAGSSLAVYSPSVFKGSYTAGPSAVISNVVKLYSAPGPAATAVATEIRKPGAVVFPNTAGLDYQGTAVCKSPALFLNLDKPGNYDDFFANNTPIYITASGIYHIKNSANIGPFSTSYLTVNDGVVAAVVVEGNLAVSGGNIQLATDASRLALYVQGNITLSNAAINSGGNTSHLTLFGGNGGSIQISKGVMYGSIYAPQHDLTLQTNTPALFGAVVAKSLTLKDSSALHFDEALRALRLDNITAGSASPGAADYLINILGGPGIQH